jgi:hypothetical protein
MFMCQFSPIAGQFGVGGMKLGHIQHVPGHIGHLQDTKGKSWDINHFCYVVRLICQPWWPLPCQERPATVETSAKVWLGVVIG